MPILLYSTGVLLLTAGLAVFAYLDRIYRELGRVLTGRVRERVESFESEIEPRLGMARRRAAPTFALLARFGLALVAVATFRGVMLYATAGWRILPELAFFLGLEVVVAMHSVPSLLLARTRGKWLVPLLPIIKFFAWLVWPIQALLDFSVSVFHLADESEGSGAPAEQEAIEALVEAATEEGILEQDEARLIEQVVEFSDKRVGEVMTPRPDVVAIPAEATIDQSRRVLVESKLSRLPVYEGSLDEVIGIVYARDVLPVSETDSRRRSVRELVRPALFVPETKRGSVLLKEMQRKNQQMAIVVNEYGSAAGVVTAEDLIEEIVGEIGEEDRAPAPDIVREASGCMVLRGSVSVEKLKELFGVELAETPQGAAPTTIAGLLNSISGHVPVAGETIRFDGLQFEVLEANQRKVLRLRARLREESGAAASAQG